MANSAYLNLASTSVNPQAARPAAVTSQVFGSRDGPGVLNSAQVLQDTWEGLGHASCPKVAVIYAEPFANHRWPARAGSESGSALNPFGHVAVALKRGEQLIVANIVGSHRPSLVNFFSAEDYLFSTQSWTAGLEQGGVYNRCFRLLALWNVADEEVARLDAFLLDLDVTSRQGEVRYDMNSPLSRNRFGWFSRALFSWSCAGGALPRYGNCASFSAEGLRAAGIGTKRTMWPKEVLLHAHDKNPTAKLITFAHAPGCPIDYGSGAMRGSFISTRPRDLIRTICSYDLTSVSDAVVQVDTRTQLARADFAPWKGTDRASRG